MCQAHDWNAAGVCRIENRLGAWADAMASDQIAQGAEYGFDGRILPSGNSANQPDGGVECGFDQRFDLIRADDAITARHALDPARTPESCLAAGQALKLQRHMFDDMCHVGAVAQSLDESSRRSDRAAMALQ